MATIEVTGGAASTTVPRRWRLDRVFFTGLSIAMVVAVFVGFSRSYYLKGVYGTPVLSSSATIARLSSSAV